MGSERPAWLRCRENGVIGEARTKAFLLDRFWILERSVDLEGADFLIQCRSRRSLLDPNPPNLGIVQVKHFQDAKTTQYLHQEYVADKQGRPRSEFFLVCHTGTDDESRMYFLESRDILENFALSAPSSKHPNCYILPGKAILADRWRVNNRKRRLDLMEQALINADFGSNRRFLSWVLPLETNESISAEYAEGIGSWEGEIRPTFFKLRQQAEAEAWTLIERLDLLSAIVNTNDPLVAVQKARELSRADDRKDGFYDPDFEHALRREKEWFAQLNEHGLLDAHASLKSMLRSKIVDDCIAKFPFRQDDIYRVEVCFDPSSLALTSFTSSLTDKTTIPLAVFNSGWNDLMGVEESSDGVTKGFVLWSAFGSQTWASNNSDPSTVIAKWVECLLAYVMLDILDQWRFERLEQPTLRTD